MRGQWLLCVKCLCSVLAEPARAPRRAAPRDYAGDYQQSENVQTRLDDLETPPDEPFPGDELPSLDAPPACQDSGPGGDVVSCTSEVTTDDGGGWELRHTISGVGPGRKIPIPWGDDILKVTLYSTSSHA